jgi:LytS/YehU family sensor histidine kinase
VAEELETLGAYLTLIEARFGDRLTCTVHVARDATQLGIPPFLLQPLVENAVRHGSVRDFGHSNILIGISLDDTRLRIRIENDIDPQSTVGEDVTAGPARTGTGLATTRDRLALLYGDAASLDAQAREGRFVVAVELPARAAVAALETPIAAHANAHR